MSSSLKSIAEKTRLSVRTVAYILNTDRASLFRAETRDRVEKAAAEVGYRPNSAAQAMRKGRFDAIGLVQAAEPSSGGMSSWTIMGIEAELHRHDHKLVMSTVSDDRLTGDGKLPRLLREWSVDGLLVNYTHSQPGDVHAALTANRVPAVWVNSKFKTDCVYPDDYEAAYRATQRLLELGHKRIAFHTCVENKHYSMSDRRAGCDDAMSSAGLRLIRLPVIRPHSHDDRLEAARRILGVPNRATAIVSYGGASEILPVYEAARELGLSVPRDLSLVGFADGKIDEIGRTIASMRIPTYEVGEIAAGMLLAKIRSGDATPLPGRAVKFLFEEGDSIGPPLQSLLSTA